MTPSGQPGPAAQPHDPFLAVVEATDDGLMVVDDSGVVRFANPAASERLRRPPDRLVGTPFGLPLVDGEGRAELDVVSPDGLLVLEMHVGPIAWDGGQAQVVTLRDVTDRVLALRRLRQSEERYALSAAAANDGLWEWDAATGRVHASARLLDMLGFPAEERDDEPGWWQERLHREDRPALAHAFAEHQRGALDRVSLEVRLRHRDGSWVWVLLRGLAVRDGDRVVRVAGSVSDITERRQAELALRRLALHDPLTGLANRALVLDHLQTAIEHARRSPAAPYAVVFMDLDQFKLVNDSLGHTAGDTLLVEVAHRLTGCVRTTDTVGRLGGDEFVVLLEAPTDREQALATVRRLREALAAPIRVGTELVYMTASMGVLLSGEAHGDAETVLRHADVAMYEAKLKGRDGYQVFTEHMQEATAQRLSLRTALRQAAATASLDVRYQPVVALDTGRVVGFEALLRWRTDDGVVLDAEEPGWTAGPTRSSWRSSRWRAASGWGSSPRASRAGSSSSACASSAARGGRATTTPRPWTPPSRPGCSTSRRGPRDDGAAVPPPALGHGRHVPLAQRRAAAAGAVRSARTRSLRHRGRRPHRPARPRRGAAHRRHADPGPRGAAAAGTGDR